MLSGKKLSFEFLGFIFLFGVLVVLILFFSLSFDGQSDNDIIAQEKESLGNTNIQSNNDLELLIPTSDPDVYFVRSNVTPYQDPDPSEKLTNWLDKSGFNLLDLFVPVAVIESVPNLKLSSDYQTYNLETLKAMGEAGDSTALLYYGLNIALKDEAQAIPVFEKALIGGGLTVAIHRIASAYDMLAEMNMNEAMLGEDSQNVRDTVLSQDQENFYTWLLTGKLLNDPVSLEILNQIAFDEKDSDIKEYLQQRASDNMLRINGQRQLQGMDNLSVMELDDDIVNFVEQRFSQ